MRSRFDVAVDGLLETEGGLVANKSDPGGITQFGISLRFLVAEGAVTKKPSLFDINHDGRIDGRDVRALTRDGAIALYRMCFWDAERLGTLPAPIDAMMLDQCVNLGPSAAKRLLKRALGVSPCTGPIDDATDAAIAACAGRRGMPALVDAYKALARSRYRAIIAANPGLAVFEKGWDARVDRLGSI